MTLLLEVRRVPQQDKGEKYQYDAGQEVGAPPAVPRARAVGNDAHQGVTDGIPGLADKKGDPCQVGRNQQHIG